MPADSFCFYKKHCRWLLFQTYQLRVHLKNFKNLDVLFIWWLMICSFLFTDFRLHYHHRLLTTVTQHRYQKQLHNYIKSPMQSLVSSHFLILWYASSEHCWFALGSKHSIYFQYQNEFHELSSLNNTSFYLLIQFPVMLAKYVTTTF